MIFIDLKEESLYSLYLFAHYFKNLITVSDMLFQIQRYDISRFSMFQNAKLGLIPLHKQFYVVPLSAPFIPPF